MPEKSKWPHADCYMGDGWSVAYRTLDAQYWGVPQRRKRIYLIADFAGRSACDILFKFEGLSRYSAEGFRSWQRAAGSIKDCVGATGFDGYNGELTGDVSSTLGVNCGMSTGRNGIVLNDQGGNRMDVTDEVTATLRAEAHHPPCDLESAGFCTEHSSKSRSIGYEEETSPTLRAGVVPAAVALENHPADSRVTISDDDKVQTLTSRMGTGGGNVPLVMNWDGEQTAPTLTAHNAGGNQRMPDKNHFNCVLQAFGISAKDSNAMKSANPHSGIYEADTSRTIDGNGGNPGCNQGGIIVIEGNGTRPSHQGDGYKESDVMYTLNTVDRHAVYAMTTGSFAQVAEDKAPTVLARDYKDPTAVCYGIGRDTFNQGKNAKFSPTFEPELQPTLVAKGPGAVQNGYTVRRLTPTECARLQGFPDWWCDDLGIEPTTDDLRYWYDVFETHRKIVGSSTKPKTLKQIAKWLRDPHSDAAEYKMWGNGVALPCVVFVLSGIVWCTQNEG